MFVIIKLMNILFLLGLILIGLCMGSFACASVWRLRAFQLVEDVKAGDITKLEKAELSRLKKLTNPSLIKDRSMCLDCSYRLQWYDMIPLVSWFLLKGKCRKCHKKIGFLEPLVEIGVSLFFVLSYVFWPYPIDDFLNIMRLFVWMSAGVGLAIIFVYDLKWYLIPDKINFTVIGIGLVNVIISLIISNDKYTLLFNIAGSVFILSGLYYLIYIFSKGKWIGFGDVKLGLGLSLLLVDWKFAFIALFSANLIGSLITIPAMAIGKLKRSSHVPFGPLLICGLVIAGLFGKYIVDIYQTLIFI